MQCEDHTKLKSGSSLFGGTQLLNKHLLQRLQLPKPTVKLGLKFHFFLLNFVLVTAVTSIAKRKKTNL